jgi:CIC family chloride channel protein
MLLSRFNELLHDHRALLPYAALGVVGGVCSAAVIILFDLAINFLADLWSGSESRESYEALPPWQQFSMPVAGAFILGLCFSALKPEDREVGIVHVLSRMHSHYGRLPLRNAIVQFLGAAVALASGQSGGREGPGVHLGAAVNSLLANRLHLPNNSQRILIACGTAGGIAVAFNTPLAGVIFAMEVIVAEYTVVGFTPVILAAVSATVMNHAFHPTGVLLTMPGAELTSLWELPFVVLLGIAAGATVALFIFILKSMLRLGKLPLLLRFTLAGFITGSLALVVPEVLGISNDTLEQALLGTLPLQLMLSLAACKLLATACGVGLGLPVGLIGPNLLIGACLGGAMGIAGASIFPELNTNVGLYTVIGMGAAMAAVLNAPLAAILAVTELTHSTTVVFPSMLAIVAANLTNRVAFRQRSAHQTVLTHLQRNIPQDPISQMLHQTNIVSAMERGLKKLPCSPDPQVLSELAEQPPRWCLLQREGAPMYLVRGEALSQALATLSDTDIIDLTELDVRRWSIVNLNERATLREALDTLRRETAEAVVVTSGNSSGGNVSGVVTRDTIDRFYLNRL